MVLLAYLIERICLNLFFDQTFLFLFFFTYTLVAFLSQKKKSE